MGVHGLWAILNPIQEHVPLRSLGGQKLAIDLSGWVCGDICVNQRAQTGCRLYLRNLVFRLIALLREAILPVAITDGVAPAVKAVVLEHRLVSRLGNLSGGVRPASLKRSQFSYISSKCSRLLEALGVPCIASPGEAEAMCSFLNMENAMRALKCLSLHLQLVDACVTDDGDAFLYGATRVYRHFSLDARMESRLGLCQRSLVLLALVLGCDYWPSGVPGIGPITACKLLTQMNIGEALRRLTGAGLDTTASASEAAVENSSVWRSSTWQKIIFGLSGCPVTQVRQKVVYGGDVYPDFQCQLSRVVDEFLSPWRARGWRMPTKASLVWSRPNVLQAVKLCADFLDWQPAYALAQFTPLLALWITRSASPSSCADIMQPLRIIRRRSVNYLPYLEVEWSRLKNDIWSESLVASGDSNSGLTASLHGFFTTDGYRLPVPEAEFRLAFPHLVLAFESLSLRALTSRMDALSVNERKGRDKQKKKSSVTDSVESNPQKPPAQQASDKSLTTAFVLPLWDSSSEGSPLHAPRSTTPPHSVDAGQQLSLPASPVENFISLRVSSHFERRLTLQSSLLAATPPPSPSAGGEFDGFRTPARLVDRLAWRSALGLGATQCLPEAIRVIMANSGEGTVWYQRTITIPPRPRGCHYITDDIIKGMPEITQIKIGTLNLFMQHTSCSITLNESWDGDVKDDIEMLLNRLIPEKLNYKHSCEGPDDMPAHAKHAILSGSNVTIPITDGRMNLGTWQGVWFIEHRNQKSARKLTATLNGCKM
ncbi:hypothetical protein TSMEX_001518 [Taenia solium]|eukprot:TsM_000691200 transcript=TsM_000691200 gene=TsM_000691200